MFPASVKTPINAAFLATLSTDQLNNSEKHSAATQSIKLCCYVRLSAFRTRLNCWVIFSPCTLACYCRLTARPSVFGVKKPANIIAWDLALRPAQLVGGFILSFYHISPPRQPGPHFSTHRLLGLSPEKKQLSLLRVVTLKKFCGERTGAVRQYAISAKTKPKKKWNKSISTVHVSKILKKHYDMGGLLKASERLLISQLLLRQQTDCARLAVKSIFNFQASKRVKPFCAVASSKQEKHFWQIMQWTRWLTQFCERF